MKQLKNLPKDTSQEDPTTDLKSGDPSYASQWEKSGVPRSLLLCFTLDCFSPAVPVYAVVSQTRGVEF
eukprot:superscaffoldBa00000317_g3743